MPEYTIDMQPHKLFVVSDSVLNMGKGFASDNQSFQKRWADWQNIHAGKIGPEEFQCVGGGKLPQLILEVESIIQKDPSARGYPAHFHHNILIMSM